MATEAAIHREDVEPLRRQFAEFRRTHAPRSRLPEELWRSAARLARRDGFETTARALAVERLSLEKWTHRFEPRASAQARKIACREPGGPASVELLAGAAIANSCRVEVESRQGGKLRLELKDIATSQPMKLIQTFAAS